MIFFKQTGRTLPDLQIRSSSADWGANVPCNRGSLVRSTCLRASETAGPGPADGCCFRGWINTDLPRCLRKGDQLAGAMTEQTRCDKTVFAFHSGPCMWMAGTSHPPGRASNPSRQAMGEIIYQSTKYPATMWCVRGHNKYDEASRESSQYACMRRVY